MKVRILQITDTHLFGKTNKKLFNVDTNKRFFEVINFIKKNKIKFDYIFLTGDISQDNTEESYHLISEELSSLHKDVYWIPGNHDNEEKSSLILKISPFFKKMDLFLEKINWSFLFLNTVIDTKDSGYISVSNIESMVKKINFLKKDQFLAVIMHHHLAEVGTPLVDKYIIENKDIFFDYLLKIEPRISVVMCGHVHGNYDISKNSIRIISSPATCFQWKKGTHEISIEDYGGFNLWEFYKNGEFNYETFFV